MSAWLRAGLRSRLLVVVVAGSALTLAVLTAGFNLVLRDRLDHDASNLLRARSEARLTTLGVVRGRIAEREAPDDAAADSQTWIYQGRRAIERPRSSTANQRAADALASAPQGFRDVPATDARLYGVPVVDRGRRLGTLVEAISLAPYEGSARTALIASLVFAVAALVAVALAANWAIRGALRPVARMTRAAADWGEHDLDRRFALGEPHDELTRLASTFDHLLDRLAASLRREQRFSAELSHELRTPLANLAAEAELALRRERSPDDYRESLLAVRHSAEQMSRTLEALIGAARAESGASRGTSDAEQAARRAIAASAGRPGDGIAVEVAPPPRPLRVGADPEIVERMLVPLIENGRRHARSAVSVAVQAGNGAGASFVVADDGPGVRPEDRERIFEPGVSLAAPEDHAGAGLGLALARRLARAAGGDVEALPSDRGARFRVRLPSG
jgi:two-component system OmpR family sensor kinase